MPELRPFHETIIEVLLDPALEEQGLVVVVNLLRVTKIPHNHDNIVMALRAVLSRLEITDTYTIACILTQKPTPMTEEEMIKETLDRR